MPRHSKGPHLWLRPARFDAAGNLSHQPTWVVVEGSSQRGTGLGAGASEKAKAEALKSYLTDQHTARIQISSRDPSQILIDDVLAKYVRDKVGKHAEPGATLSRITILRKFWSGKMLSEVTGDTCDAYVDQRSTPSAARRELEDLRSAIIYHRKRGLHDKLVSVALPEKNAAREKWFEREEAAALIKAAWNYREIQKGFATEKRSRRHVAHFMVFARYMGARSGVICATSIEQVRPVGLPWCDLRHGIFYGRPEGQRETKKRRQKVRIPPPLLAHLRRWRKLGHRYVVEWNGERVLRITKAHDAVIAAAGLGVEYTPHIWRHTVATWLMQAGTDPWKTANFLAMSVETLLRVYGHHRPDDSAAVHQAFHDHRKRPTAGSPPMEHREQKVI